VAEFVYGGEVRHSPDPATCSDAEWSGYVFNRSGAPGDKYEWWCHIASGFWFVVLRDTTRDVVIATFPAESVRLGLLSSPATPGVAS
jgi:sarcosine oxidase subunit delta